MKKFLFFSMLLFATCLAYAAVSVDEGPPILNYEIIVNVNYSDTVDVIDLQSPCMDYSNVSHCQLVPEVTIVTYICATVVPNQYFNKELSQSLIPPLLYPEAYRCITEPVTTVSIYLMNKQLALK